MKMKKFMLLVGFLLCVSCLQGLAQNAIQPNLKFGSPTKEEMELSACPYDPDAKAMVLCSVTDVDYIYAHGDFKIEYTVKKRVKIFSQEGADAANVSIVYYSPVSSGGSREMLRSIKATAYNMENGKIVKTKMGNELVFEERIDQRKVRTKFTVPQAKAGTVIEFQYVKSSDFYYQIDDWYAQEKIPVLYTSYEVEIPSVFVFNFEQSGANYLQNSSVPTSKRYVAEADAQLANRYTFKGSNLPALKEEKFVWCPEMYASKISFELRNISIPGAYYKNFTTTWKDIDDLLMGDDDFGSRIKRSNPLKDEMAAARLDTITDFKRKLAATFLLLKKRVKWDGTYALVGSSSRNVLKEGKASNADINFLLMNMLKSLDVKTVPLLMRLRSHGILPISHPSVDALNTFVVGIYENDSTMHVMDGSAEAGYVDVLPPVLLTVAHEMNGDQVNLRDQAIAKQTVLVKAVLKNDGKLVGSMQTRFQDLAALMKKKAVRNAKDSAEYVTQIADDLNVQIKSYKTSGMKKFSPQAEEYLEFEKAGELSDIVYLNPILDVPFKDVPLTDVERVMPVEFDAPMSQTYMARIKLPANYVLEEEPKPIFLRNADRTLSFKMQTRLEGNVLMVNYSFNISKSLFFQNEYDGLKSFLEDVNNKLKTVVVLKKKVL